MCNLRKKESRKLCTFREKTCFLGFSPKPFPRMISVDSSYENLGLIHEDVRERRKQLRVASESEYTSDNWDIPYPYRTPPPRRSITTVSPPLFTVRNSVFSRKLWLSMLPFSKRRLNLAVLIFILWDLFPEFSPTVFSVLSCRHFLE